MYGIGALDGGSSNGELLAIDGMARGAEDFYKALQAGHGTDHAALTGGAALRRESLEASILVTIQKNQHFVLFNKLAQSPAISTVDEWTTQTDVGGVPGSGAVGELVDIPENTGTYTRNVGLVKFLKDRRRVSVEAEVQSQNGLASAIARETDNGTRKLLTDCEWLAFYGNAACNSAEFDGLKTLLEARGGDAVYDLRGQPLSADAKELIDSARYVWDQGQWGMATDLFCSPMVKADLNLKLDPAHRVVLGANPAAITKGANVTKIETGFGVLDVNTDPFIQESGMPYTARGGNYAALVSSAGVTPVTSVTNAAAVNASSQFLAAHAGNYYYAVEAGNASGRSTLVKSLVVAVAAGESVTVTIDPDAASNATYFVVYRSRRNGTNADADFREVARIAANALANVNYVDHNQNIPGTSIAPILTMQEDAITLRRLLPMTRFPLFPSTKAEHTWAQLLFVYLRVGKINQHRLLKNILPSSATWLPF